ncbi:MAG TPA: trehalose-6-phosphate synthase, partial [Acidimicrobiales bacterium]|nr:trehalose-6-phosphate synthase [Acidimicrobiales bacterium]
MFSQIPTLRLPAMPTMPSEGSLSGGKLVVISNRGPAELIRADDTSVVSRRARGGLASSLALMLSGSGATWICAAMGPAEREISASGEVPASHEGIELQMLLVDESDYAMAYQVVSNGILWFTYHDLFDKVRRPHFDRRFLDAWDAYIRVNRLFAQEAASKAAGGATVLVQDYHFHLVGKFLKELRPDLSVVHFVHTPFCEPGVLGVLPDKVARELLTSMSAYDACGFHSDRWRSAFLACCAAYGVAAPSTFSSPLGVDERPLLETSRSTECINEAKRLATACGDRKLVVRVDRVELSKNIVRGFLAFDRMLELHPEFVGDVTFLALAYPSRES